jgi:hypothetical protein
MVVPYVKPIEKPTDTKIQELDSQISSILSNPKLSVNEKVQMYSQLMAKFQTHFNPDNYGESPSMINLSNTVELLADNIEKMSKEKAEIDKSKLQKSDEIAKNITTLSENIKTEDKYNILQDIELMKENINEIKNSLKANKKRKKELKVNNEPAMESDRSMYQSFNGPVSPPGVFETPLGPRGQNFNPNTIKYDNLTPAMISPLKKPKKKSSEIDRLDPNKTNIIKQTGQGLWLTKEFFK